MKKIILSIFILATLTVEAQEKQANQFVLNGTLNGVNTGMMYLYYSNDEDTRIKDSAAIVNGIFSFKGEIDEPTMAYLALKEEKRTNKNSVSFFLEPSEMAVQLLLNKFNDATFTGSKTQDEYAALQAKKNKVEKRWAVVMDTLTEVNKRSNVEYQKLKDWALLPYFAEMKDLDYTFFANHPQSPVTAFELGFHVTTLTLDSLEMFYNRLGKKIQQSNNGKHLAIEIQKLRAGSPGSIAANFKAIDINGSPISLSDFKGKYVLLDFWASWCVPCRASNPHMIKLYHQYHTKGLDIIGVSDDDSKPDAWKKAVAKDGVGIWHNVLRGFDKNKMEKGEKNEKDIAEKYGIHSLPTKILIDRKGAIIGRYDQGTDEEEKAMDAKLKSIFSAEE